MMGNLWVLGHLLLLSAEDIAEHRISLAVILELGGTGFFYAAASGRMPQIWPGIFLLVIGYFTQEKIGYGDGWLLLALGMWMEFRKLLWTFFGGIGFGSLYALLFCKKELPLVPFLTITYMMGEWL